MNHSFPSRRSSGLRAEAVVDTSNHSHVVRQLRRVCCADIVVPGGRPRWDQAIVNAVDAAVAVEIKLHVLILDIHVPHVAGQFEASHGYDRHLSFEPEDGGRSEEHTSELQSLMRISYAVF